MWRLFLLPYLAAVARGATDPAHALVEQVRAALGHPTTADGVAAAFVDDRFGYLRERADFEFAADGAASVRATFRAGGPPLPRVPVVAVGASHFNASALCAFLDVGAPYLESGGVEGYVVLSLGSAAFGSPFHPAILRRLRATCGRTAADLEALLLSPKLRRWFVSQHFPRANVEAESGGPRRHPRGRAPGDPAVGDIAGYAAWVLHAKLVQTPLGAPRVFSREKEREAIWLELAADPPRRSDGVYVNFKPRDYRNAVLAAVAPGLGDRLGANAYVGKERLKRNSPGDGRAYVAALFAHAFVLSPPGSGVDCYRHWEALLCGAIPIVEYSPLAVELLAGTPALIVRDWADVDADLLATHLAWARSTTFDFRKLTTAYWRAELARAGRAPNRPPAAAGAPDAARRPKPRRRGNAPPGL